MIRAPLPRTSNFVPPVCPQRAFVSGNGEGPPGGRPFHCRAVVRLNYRKDVVFRRPGPPRRQGSSSRVPATPAIDNETLDHLLSMTDLALAALGRPALAMFHDWRRQRLPDAASRRPAGDTICVCPPGESPLLPI